MTEHRWLKVDSGHEGAMDSGGEMWVLQVRDAISITAYTEIIDISRREIFGFHVNDWSEWCDVPMARPK